MAEEKQEKIILEREYIVPLRKRFLNTPKYRRTPKAIKALKEFIARHMKIYDRDLGKVKLDKYLNEEMWFRGIQKPLSRIKVKVKKFSDDKVVVELAELSEKAKYKKAREEKIKEIVKKKKAEDKKEEKAGEKIEERGEEETVEEKKEEIEKEKSTVEAGLKEADEKAKEVKHEIKLSKQPKHPVRMALKK